MTLAWFRPAGVFFYPKLTSLILIENLFISAKNASIFFSSGLTIFKGCPKLDNFRIK